MSSATLESLAQQNQQKPSFVCETCGSRYSRIEYLHRHERTHSETKPFQCEYCDKRYARSDVLFRHRRKCGPAAQTTTPNETSTATSSSKSSRKKARPYPAPEPVSPVEEAPDSLGQPDMPNADARSPEGLVSPEDTSDILAGPSDRSDSILSSSSLDTPATVPSTTTYSVFDVSTSPYQTQSHTSVQPQWTTSDLTLFDFTSPNMESYLYGYRNAVPPNASAASLSQVHYAGSSAARELNSMLDINQPLFLSEPPALSLTIRDAEEQDDQPLLTQETGPIHEDPYFWTDHPFETEPTMVSSELEILRVRCGSQSVDSNNPFYFDASRLLGCYSVDRWKMPPVAKLTASASRTFNTLLEHLGVIHLPTFKLSEQHSAVIFAMCTTAPPPNSDLRKTTPSTTGETPQIRRALEELASDQDWEKTQNTIRAEKTQSIISHVYRNADKRKLTAEEALPFIHSLLLYNSSSFLSEKPDERLAGELFLQTITAMARQSGLFNPGADCTKPGLAHVGIELSPLWNKFIYHESFRRTVWLVYTLDTLASLESNAAANIPPREIRHLPLPYANFIWGATTAQSWSDAITPHAFSGLTLDAAMSCICTPTEHLPRGREGRDCELYYQTCLGAYGRLILILTVLRGIIAWGKGEPKGGYVMQRWMKVLIRKKIGETLGGKVEGEAMKKLDPLVLHKAIISSWSCVLDKWRRGWDFDLECHLNYRGTYFIDDALPPYWLCRALLDKLSTPPAAAAASSPSAFSSTPGSSTNFFLDDDDDNDDGENRLAEINLRDMLTTARQFVASGEGLGVAATPPTASDASSSSPSASSDSSGSVDPKLVYGSQPMAQNVGADAAAMAAAIFDANMGLAAFNTFDPTFFNPTSTFYPPSAQPSFQATSSSASTNPAAAGASPTFRQQEPLLWGF